MSFNPGFIKDIIKNHRITSLDSYDVQAAIKAADYFDLFLEISESIAFPVEQEDGSMVEELPSHDARLVAAAILTAAAALSPR